MQGAYGDGTVHGNRDVHPAFRQANVGTMLAHGCETESLQSIYDIGAGKIAGEFRV